MVKIKCVLHICGLQTHTYMSVVSTQAFLSVRKAPSSFFSSFSLVSEFI
jgi:hypothetical protein